MKTHLIAAAFALGTALGLGACAPTAPEAPVEEARPVTAPSGEYTIDPTHTTVTLRVRHFGLSDYVLRFNTVSGGLNFNAEDPTQSSVHADVAVTSLSTPYAGDRDFDAELQNSEWLDAAGFPVATFRSTAIERTGPNTARITGDLSIRGQTHPLILEASYNGSHAQHPLGPQISLVGFSARGEISRSAYGVSVLLPSAPGASDGVSDTVELLIEAEFVRPAASPVPAN